MTFPGFEDIRFILLLVMQNIQQSDVSTTFREPMNCKRKRNDALAPPRWYVCASLFASCRSVSGANPLILNKLPALIDDDNDDEEEEDDGDEFCAMGWICWLYSTTPCYAAVPYPYVHYSSLHRKMVNPSAFGTKLPFRARFRWSMSFTQILL